jgi:macrodomain Ter protein organizer (MatP/YcbG family)
MAIKKTSIDIEERLWTRVKSYCSKNNLKVGGWLESLIKKELKDKHENKDK